MYNNFAVNEIEYGKGTSTTRQGARDEAAMNALRALQEELNGRVRAVFWWQLEKEPFLTSLLLPILALLNYYYICCT